MAFIDSSLNSPLATIAQTRPAPEEEPDEGSAVAEPDKLEDDEAPSREPKDRVPAGSLQAQLIANIEDVNLARYIDDNVLDQIGMDCVREYEIDENSRKTWVDRAIAAMKFATQEPTPKTFPWPGASSVIFPMIAQSAIDFAARTYPAIIQNKSVVKGVVVGSDRGTPATDDGTAEGKPRMQPAAQPGAPPMPVWLVEPGEKRKRADRIGEHMSWQLLDQMEEWEPQTDQMLHEIPVAGGAIRKTYYDPIMRQNRSLKVSIMNLVWNYHAPSFATAPRHSEKQLVYPHVITEYERFDDDGEGGGGMWLHRDYGAGGGTDGQYFGYDEEAQASSADDPDAPQFFIEQHSRLDLDEDGYPEPYIVTTHLRSAKVVRIVARYDEQGIDASEDGETINRIEAVDHYTLYPFLPSIDGGSYPTGFGHLLKPLNSAINTTLNQMFDAGTLQNAGGGFVSDQLGLPSGQTLFQVGKYVRVNSKGGAIRDAVYPVEFKGPSVVLFQLLGLLITSCKEIASLSNVLSGDAAIANAPPTTILALIEQGMKLYTAIHKRIYRAEKAELKKLYRLNRLHLQEAERYQIGDEWREITPEDYRLGGGVEPVADPTMTTDMQKLGRAQIAMSVAEDPLINRKEVLTRLFEAANMDRIEDLFAQPDPTAAQMAMARNQAELGKVRSEELKNQTQAFLNMALARKNASAAEETQLNAQLEYIRLRIEAVNSQIKADTVDHRFHDTNTRANVEHARMAHDAVLAGGPTPAPAGPFPEATAEPPLTPQPIQGAE